MVVGFAFGAPQIFAPIRSETLQNKCFGASGLKIGAPQKRNDHGSNARFSALRLSEKLKKAVAVSVEKSRSVRPPTCTPILPRQPITP